MSGAGAGATDKAKSTSDHYQVVLHVDEKTLSDDGVKGDKQEISGNRGESQLPVETIWRALHARDGGCAFPGCSHSRFSDAHHIQHWAYNGETSLENTLLLCSAHHRQVHEGGFTIDRDHKGKLFFRRADGKAIPDAGYSRRDWFDGDLETDQVNDSAESSCVHEARVFYLSG